ncbi:MAG TPA: LysR family transcriptional regulator [Microbacteriaceae bacterium]|nr:LysR family transcriptional regulator [Microbacteriaceae bacterium]
MSSTSPTLPPGLDWELEMQALRLALAIQETGSISAAAHRLGYSQPAVSQQLRRAEAGLGVAIVTRAGRGVRLTEAGTLLAARARVVHAELADAFASLADLAEGITGHVRVAAFPSASSALVPAILAHMRERHPRIDVSFIEEEPPAALGMLADGTVDVAITFSYEDDPGDPHRASVRTLRARELFTEPVYAVLPTDHPAARGTSAELADLADEDWIAGCPRCRGHLLEVCRTAGFAPSIRRETDNVIAVLGMVRAGLGVGLLPALAITGIGVPEGVALLPTSPASPRTVHAVTGPDAERVPAIAAAIAAIRQIVADLALA